MRISTDERIGEGDGAAVLFFAKDDARKVFQVYLVADSGVGRHYFEILKTLLAPAQERIALDIALHFEVGVEGKSTGYAEFIHLDGVVNHQFGGKQGIDFFRITA